MPTEHKPRTASRCWTEQWLYVDQFMGACSIVMLPSYSRNGQCFATQHCCAVADVQGARCHRKANKQYAQLPAELPLTGLPCWQHMPKHSKAWMTLYWRSECALTQTPTVQKQCTCHLRWSLSAYPSGHLTCILLQAAWCQTGSHAVAAIPNQP